MRNILLIILIAIVGISGHQYYATGDISWPDQIRLRLMAFYQEVQSRWEEREQEAPFVFDRSSQSERIVESGSSNNVFTNIFTSGKDRFELVGHVSDVVDGDSFELRVKDMVLQVRLFGIDTPEFNQSHGDAASQALHDKISRQRVTVSVEDIDAYSRYVGTVYLQDENINVSMVAEGHAWWYERYARGYDELEDAQREARAAGLGLWAESNPVPPWDWRQSR